ncbi:sulfite exporter TauE/SafE family protein [Natrialbaceae archaeon A-arb3/5]
MPELALLLVVIALAAGVGITAIGPGGIFVTIALFALTPLASAEVAGSASATFVATGLIGAVAYARSGEFATGFAREATIVLSVTSIAGALLGTRLNLFVSEDVFAAALALFVGAIGLVIISRELVGLDPEPASDSSPPSGGQPNGGPLDTTARRRWGILSAVGTGIGIAGGMLGVGGPVLAVPLLVVLGTPMLIALAVAQVQSVFVSGFATVGYLSVDAVVWPVVALVGIPQVIGVVIGWRIAHVVDAGRLRVGLGFVLVLVAPVIAM